ncbi:MAG: ParB/RepB/Spo0J family partition protein [Tissierellia bacterium]|nr:ParB/RepB/Spo0J family partition protein [Tissierellia bacterium]
MAVKRRGLGKGLSALIPEERQLNLMEDEADKGTVVELDISSIEPNKEQPRKTFEKEPLEELKNSIKQYGLLQPLVVRKVGGKYEIIAGERRWRAAKEAKIKKVPCIIKEVDDTQALKLALIENIQRENLNPIEEAQAYKTLIDEYDLTQEEVALALGKSRSYIANTIRLLNLDDEIIEYISEGKITSGHGKVLLGIKDKRERLELAKGIVENKLNVRETEKIASKAKKKVSSKVKMEKNPIISQIEEGLMRALGTKVSIITKKNGGKIEIEYYSDEDLQRIIEVIGEEDL